MVDSIATQLDAALLLITCKIDGDRMGAKSIFRDQINAHMEFFFGMRICTYMCVCMYACMHVCMGAMLRNVTQCMYAYICNLCVLCMHDMHSYAYRYATHACAPDSVMHTYASELNGIMHVMHACVAYLYANECMSCMHALRVGMQTNGCHECNALRICM
jgi:hypothetical protein